jgi:hypothetical protein
MFNAPRANRQERTQRQVRQWDAQLRRETMVGFDLSRPKLGILLAGAALVVTLCGYILIAPSGSHEWPVFALLAGALASTYEFGQRAWRWRRAIEVSASGIHFNGFTFTWFEVIASSEYWNYGMTVPFIVVSADARRRYVMSRGPIKRLILQLSPALGQRRLMLPSPMATDTVALLAWISHQARKV